MSRSQTTGAADTAKDRSNSFYNNSQNSYADAQTDVGNYEKSLGDYAADVSKFQSSNPYVKGGQFDVASNQQTANTSDAMARSAGEALQGQALRTGENSAGSIGATERMEEQGTRDLQAEQAKLTQTRIGNEAGYNEKGVGMQGDVTKATEFPVAAETSLSGQQGNLSEEELKNAMQAYESAPSFGDQFGSAFAASLGKGAGKFLVG